MFHYRAGQDDPYIVPVIDPGFQEVLSMMLVFVPRDDEMEIYPGVFVELEPP